MFILIEVVHRAYNRYIVGGFIHNAVGTFHTGISKHYISFGTARFGHGTVFFGVQPKNAVSIKIIKNRDKTFFINNTAKYMPLCFRHSGKEFQTVVNLPFRNTRIFFREDFQDRLKR